MARYGQKAQTKVATVMRERKSGTLRSSSGAKVTSRKQAVAIGLSEARRAGAKVPAKTTATKAAAQTARTAAKRAKTAVKHATAVTKSAAGATQRAARTATGSSTTRVAKKRAVKRSA